MVKHKHGALVMIFGGEIGFLGSCKLVKRIAGYLLLFKCTVLLFYSSLCMKKMSGLFREARGELPTPSTFCPNKITVDPELKAGLVQVGLSRRSIMPKT